MPSSSAFHLWNRIIITASIMGVMASTYALYVELSAEHQPGFKAMCDINEYASCSRVLTSKYSKGFGILPTTVPNCMYGTAFYCLIIFLTSFENFTILRVQLLCSILGVLTSVYLACLLMFVLQDICLVCVTTYICNGIIATFVYKKFKAMKEKRK